MIRIEALGADKQVCSKFKVSGLILRNREVKSSSSIRHFRREAAVASSPGRKPREWRVDGCGLFLGWRSMRRREFRRPLRGDRACGIVSPRADARGNYRRPLRGDRVERN